MRMMVVERGGGATIPSPEVVKGGSPGMEDIPTGNTAEQGQSQGLHFDAQMEMSQAPCALGMLRVDFFG